MKKPRFLPLSEADKKQWLQSFQTNLPQIARSLNLDPAEVQEIAANVSKDIANIEDVYEKDSAATASVRSRNEHREVFYPKLSTFVYRLKAHKDYSQSLGELVNIETSFSTKATKVISDTGKLAISFSPSTQRVTMKFRRPAQHLVRVYCRRGTETEFTLLNVVAGLKYEDLRPNLNNAPAEKREYVFSLGKNDSETERSAVYSIAVMM